MGKGIFNHTNGEIQNSVYCGSFENGLFKSSSLTLMLREIMN
jgi:hypothetical protein